MRQLIKKAKAKSNPVTREEMIALMRTELLKRAGDDDVSACKIAAEQGIFCRGFARYSDLEMRRRYDWIARRRPKLTRPQLEEIANLWQLARQDVQGCPIACDVQQKEEDTCRGWNDFTNEDLARFYFEMTGIEIAIA